jgi:MIP family channel proteins
MAPSEPAKQGWAQQRDNTQAKDTGRNLARAVTAEFAAMFIFVFVCVGCALTTTGTGGGGSGAPGAGSAGSNTTATLTISLCFGFTIFVLAHCFGHISGAHVNPAVTLALMIGREIPLVKGCLYMCAQFMASIISSGILMAVMGLKTETMGGYNALTGPDDNKVWRGFILEMVLTFVLVFTVYATIDPNRAATGQGPLAIGMAVMIAHFIAVPATGCGINPARSLGPAIFADQDEAREDLWVFLTAPFLGGALAAVAYLYWFAEKHFSLVDAEAKKSDDPESQS